jgi:hypothetical protein
MHAMCVWSLNMSKTSTIEGRTMEQYLSAVNMHIKLVGLGPPDKPAYGTRLYVEVRKSIDG